LITVRAKLPHAPESLLGDSLQAFTGNADQLTYAELRVLGLEVTRGYAKTYMDETEVAERFVFKEISPGTVQRPQLVAVATDHGVEVVATAPEASRRIRIRGRE
jgi:hypothetical protein